MLNKIKEMGYKILAKMDKNTIAFDVIVNVIDGIMEATGEDLILDYEDLNKDRKLAYGKVTGTVICADEKIHKIVVTMDAVEHDDLPFAVGKAKPTIEVY